MAISKYDYGDDFVSSLQKSYLSESEDSESIYNR